MDAYNRFNRCIFEWERVLLKVVGHDFLGGKFEKNLMTFFLYGIIAFTGFMIVYTMIFYDPLAKIFSLLFSLIALQVRKFKSMFVIITQFSFCFISGRYKTVPRSICGGSAMDYTFRSEALQNSYQNQTKSSP